MFRRYNKLIIMNATRGGGGANAVLSCWSQRWISYGLLLGDVHLGFEMTETPEARLMSCEQSPPLHCQIQYLLHPRNKCRSVFSFSGPETRRGETFRFPIGRPVRLVSLAEGVGSQIALDRHPFMTYSSTFGPKTQLKGESVLN